MNTRCLLPLLAVLATLWFCPRGHTAPGDLDPAFGNGGKVTTPIGDIDDLSFSVAVQSDGKIVSAGTSDNGSSYDFALVRYTAAGALDTSFGGGGKLTTGIGSRNDYGRSVAVESGGKILVAGHSHNGSNNDFALVRYTTGGALDATFGSGGIVTTDFNSRHDLGWCVAVQSDGKILVAGYSGSYPNSDFALARYTAAGELDTSFGSGGKTTTDFGSTDDYGYSVSVQVDGKIVVAGYSATEGNSDFAIVRYTTVGALDMSFGIGGKVFTSIGSGDDYGRSAAVQSDGKIILAGVSNGNVALVRYTAAGALDTSFGNSGSVITDLGSNDSSYKVAVQSDEKILLAGYTNLDFSLVRYTATGALDASFGTGGKVTTDFNSGSADSAFGMAVQNDGKIVLSGTSDNGSNRHFALVRYIGGNQSAPPTLTAPAANSVTKSPVTVTFTLPEAAMSGSVKVTFVRTTDPGFTRTLTLAASQESAGEHTFTFDPANVVASSGGAVASFSHANFPDLTYDVTLSYQDAAGNPAASATNDNVRIDTITQVPNLSFPKAGDTFGGVVDGTNRFNAVSFTLPEAALAGSVKLTFDDGATQRVLTLGASVEPEGDHKIYFDPADPVGTSLPGDAIASVTNGPAIPDGGPYSISFTYQDALGNTAVQSNVVTGVTIDLVTQTPTLTLPTTSAFIRNSATVNFTLPEAALDSPGVMTLSFGATTLTLDQSLRTAGNHSFTFDPADPVGTSGGAIVSGSALADGTYTVTFSYRDEVLNPTATATATNVTIDRVPPTFNPNFSPTIVYAGTALANYESQTGASDPNGLFVGGLGSQSPPPGTVLTAGTQRVAFNVADNAGNSASTFFDLLVRPLTPPSEVVLAKDSPAPGAGGASGLPGDAELASFGVPAIDDDGALAFTAKWTSDTSGKGSGLFTDSACLAIVGGDASALAGVATAKWKSFSDPVIHDGQVVCLATLSGVPKSSAAVVFMVDADGPAIIARAGGAATEDEAKWKSFKAVGCVNGAVGFLAQLTPGTGMATRTSAANDTGLWLTQPGSNAPQLALREGQLFDDAPIKTLVAFKPGNGSPGQGRGWLRPTPSGGKALVHAMLMDHSQHVLSVDSNGEVDSLLSSGRPVQTGSGVEDYRIGRLGLPAVNAAGQIASLSSLIGGLVQRGIVADLDNDGAFETVAVVEPEPRLVLLGSFFTALKDPVLADDGGVAFPATIAGRDEIFGPEFRGIRSRSLWWKPPGQTLTRVAQGGAQPPDLPAGAQWNSFPSLAIATNRGPIFSATLVPGQGGVTPKSASGVWACDFLGAPRLLFRTGVPDAIVPGKTLKSFTLLNATKGSTGVTRSFNSAQQVAWLATFDDNSQAIVTTEVP